jgi:hypothetical protein
VSVCTKLERYDTEALVASSSIYARPAMFDCANGCVLYDQLAGAVVADPGIASFQEMAVGVDRSFCQNDFNQPFLNRQISDWVAIVLLPQSILAAKG